MSEDKPEGEDPRHAIEIPEGDPGRRRFLKIATCAIGGGIGIVVAVPAVKFLLYPVGEKVVSSADEPLDLLALDQLQVGAPPTRVIVVARSVRDAWASQTDVALGAVWLTRPEGDKVVAFSSVCPHLGCAVQFDAGAGHYKCPCHESAFTATGEYMSGPAERGLDPLEVTVDKGRVLVKWVRFAQGGADRVQV